MLTYNENESQKLIEIKLSGKFTKKDFQQAAEKIKPRIEQWDDIRILEVIEDLDGMDMDAIAADMKFGFENIGMLKKFKRCAIVADEKWIRSLSDMVGRLIETEVKGFNLEEKDQAKKWLMQ